MIKSLQGVDQAEQVIQQLSILSARLDSYGELLRSRQEVKQGLKEIAGEIKEIDSRARGLADEYGELLQRVGRCPTCFAEINQDTIARIRQEVL